MEAAAAKELTHERVVAMIEQFLKESGYSNALEALQNESCVCRLMSCFRAVIQHSLATENRRLCRGVIFADAEFATGGELLNALHEWSELDPP